MVRRNIHLMCSSKKGISAHQLHRSLDITYKSAWLMCHRIREAMSEKGELILLSGTIEVDETYVAVGQEDKVCKERATDEIQMGMRPKRRAPLADKTPVLGILERGGRVRTQRICNVNADAVQSILRITSTCRLLA